MAKTWQQKYDDKKEIRIKRLAADFADIRAGETMLISTPQEIAAYIRSIPEKENKDLSGMRRDLAAEAKTDKTCPVTTAIFTRIVAERSLELMAEGSEPVAPFWKVIEPNSPLAKKLSCGSGFIEQMRSILSPSRTSRSV